MNYRTFLNTRFDDAATVRRQFEAARGDSLHLDDFPDLVSFVNTDQTHAGQTVDKLVRTTTRSLDILCENYSSAVHSAQRLRALVARQPRVKVRILVEGKENGPIFIGGRVDCGALETAERSSALRDFSASEIGEGKSIEIKVSPVQSPIHFMVSDNVAWRVERDRVNRRARVNAFGPHRAAQLAELFDDVWERSAPVRLENQVGAAAVVAA